MSTLKSTLTRTTDTRKNMPTKSVNTNGDSRFISMYQSDQQAKFLNLQADLDSLLIELQNLQQQKEKHTSKEK